jgi:hypothetical protein
VREGWQFQVIGTSSITHQQTPTWYAEFKIERLVAAVLEKINSRGSVTGVQNHQG